MALSQTTTEQRLAPILEAVAAELGRRGITIGDPSSSNARLHVRREESVCRVIKVYWTPFQADIPGVSIGLHLEIDKPTKHWVEAYISPESVSWIFCFHERPVDGEYQLAYYQQTADPVKAVKDFFDLASWYTLTPTDVTWRDVMCAIDSETGWSEAHNLDAAGAELDKSIQESLKKSTIVWLRWRDSEDQERTMPVWFVFQDGKLYVISGERQQTVPDAERLRRAEIIIRWKGHGNARVAELPVDVRIIRPGPEWDPIAEKLAEKRLNTPGAPEDTARRWRDDCVILELTPR